MDRKQQGVCCHLLERGAERVGFIWTSQNIKWFERAAVQTAFYTLVANHLRDIVSQNATVYDLGCGTGYLSLELSPFVGEIIAVDWNEEAIGFLQRKSKERNIGNISCELRDWRNWKPGKPADLVCVSYCGGFMEHFRALLELTNQFLVGVFPLEQRSNQNNQETFPKVVQFLQDNHISFESTTISCEFGQPLESLEECRDYVHHYSKTPKNRLTDEVLTGFLINSEGGHYLPKTRNSGLIMVGWNYQLRKGERKFILEQYQKLPNLGGWYSSNTGNMEEILKVAPDVIISFGTTGKKDIEQAEEIQKQLGIPVVIIDSELTKLDQAYTFAGELLGAQEKAAELGAYCKQSVEDVTAESKQIDDSKRVRVYYAEGAKGLETDPQGSRHTQVLDLVGGINVADVEMKEGKGLTQVSIEQVMKWNPEVIISWDDERGGYYSGIAKDSTWQGIQAVQNKKIYEIPTSPFNWFDRPPSVNRVLGIKWLGNLLYPELYAYDMKAEVKDFYKKFYHYELTDKEVEELLERASSHTK